MSKGNSGIILSRADTLRFIRRYGYDEIASKLNKKRCADNGVGDDPQRVPLPGVAENIRAFVLRIFER